jgi:DNA-binding beta-propeller fold protein YncE
MRDASWPAPGLILLLACALVHGPAWASHLIVIANDGKEPHRDGSYHVLASPQPDSVVVLDASTFPPQVVAEIPNVPNSNSGPPQSLCLTPDERLVLVSAPNHIDPHDPTKLVADDYVSVVDLEASPPRVIEKVMVGKRPLGIACSPTGRVALVADWADATVSVLTIDHKHVTRTAAVPVGHPEGKTGLTGVAISPDGQWALATKRFEDSVALLHIDGTQVTYLAERDVFEVRSGPRTGDIAVGSNPRAVAMAPDGRWAAVANIGLNSGDTDSVSIIDMTLTPPQGVDVFPVGQRPEAVAISPDGHWLAVGIMHGSNKRLESTFRHEYSKVLLYAMQGATATKVGEARGGKNQQGVIFTRDGQYIIGQNYEEGELAAYAVTPTGLQDTGWRLPIQGASPAAITTAPPPLR